MSSILGLLATLLYLAATGRLIYVLNRASHVQQTPARPPLITLWGTAVVLHALVLATEIFTPTGLSLGFFHALSMVAWLIALILLVASLRRPMEVLGVALLPFAAVALALGMAFPQATLISNLMDPGLKAHILLSLLAYSLLMIAAFQAILLATQNRHLHNHHPGGFVRALPPLQFMESLLFQVIGLGFLLLSASLVTGFMFLDDIFAQHLVHKTALSIAAWCLFALLLWGRWQFGWRGRIAVRWTLGGFVALMLAYFGSKLVLELLLQR
ncbi:MAG: cytochrome c biogenesis protein CcsA [Chromatiales bacterium]|jgi:ABC-type uncharacterized transport system permease subunit|nr:cytochrome c biogenesis protein CcsA [Chromatiales bacterium]MDX9767253.1 cytochrome c biogenesis protein CcsA [Ectothiorhodospiraceae bacterium]